MKRLSLLLLFVFHVAAVFGQQAAPTLQSAPEIPFESVPFLKLTPDRNLGEVLGVAVNSKNHVIVLNHPGSARTGPVYGESANFRSLTTNSFVSPAHCL